MIQAEHVSYTYSPGGVFEKRAVSDVNFTIEDGTFCGLIGHTGSGKTTLVQMMAGLEKPTGGRILVDGMDIADKKNRAAALRGKVGLVFQYPEYQLFCETVLEDVMFGPKNMGCSEKEAEEKAKRALCDVGVDEALWNSSPFELSGGQKRRVAIAGVLAFSPRILILDEPTAGLDPAGRDEILDQLYTLHIRDKITVLLVSHSMEDMARYAQRILVMDGGKLALDGTPETIFSQGEKLRGMGLDIPDITRVVLGLRARGIPVSEKIYTVEAAKQALLGIWRDKICSEI